MRYTYYISSFDTYSEKAYQVSFGFINQKNKFKQSMPIFIPKWAVRKLDLRKKTIALKGSFVGKNQLGYLHHYKILRENISPVRCLAFRNLFINNVIAYKFILSLPIISNIPNFNFKPCIQMEDAKICQK